MKKILLPTDFSENAWNAIQYAIELHKDETCVFYLLNTYTPTIANARFMISGICQGQSEDSAQKDSKINLEKMLLRIRKTFNNRNHSFKSVSSFSLLVDEIRDNVERNRIDLIIIGNKGESDINNVFMGSNALHIIKSVKNCPVLSVPRPSLLTSPRRIAFISEFDRLYSSLELYPIIDLARNFNSFVHIVHISDEVVLLSDQQKYILGMLKSCLKDIGHSVHILHKTISIAHTYDNFKKSMNIDLMAVGNGQLGSLEKITGCADDREVAFHTEIPLLILPESLNETFIKSLQPGETGAR